MSELFTGSSKMAADAAAAYTTACYAACDIVNSAAEVATAAAATAKMDSIFTSSSSTFADAGGGFTYINGDKFDVPAYTIFIRNSFTSLSNNYMICAKAFLKAASKTGTSADFKTAFAAAETCKVEIRKIEQIKNNYSFKNRVAENANDAAYAAAKAARIVK